MHKIEFKGESYPAWQASGNAARFSMPWALEVCKGLGVDIGCNRAEWAFPGAIQVDPAYTAYDAMNLPVINETVEVFDYIFSSHCAEHLEHWVNVFDYWHSRLKSGGVLFLYLPDHSQKYWRSWSNRKHRHQFTPQIIGDYFRDQPEMWSDVIVSNVDLNHSFVVIAYKK